jgi:RNA polymerase sigma factor (sigma-70 family)
MPDAELGAAVRHLRALAAPHDTRGPTDGALLSAFAAGDDRDAFAALVRRHGPLVLGVCRRVLRHQQDAEDAFQATFLLLARAAGSVRKRESLASWLHGVAYRMARNAQRAAARRRRHEGRVEPAAPPNPAWEAAWREVQALLDAEVQRLPAAYREPFVLCCLESQSCAAVARRLGVKEGTVWSRLAKARELLRQRLTARGVALPAVLTGVALAPAAATAAVPHPLAAATVAAALSTVHGLEAGAVSANVAALVKGAKGIMMLTKTNTAVVCLLTAGVLGAGLGAATHLAAQQRAGEPPAPKAAAPSGPRPPAPAVPFGEGWAQTVEASRPAEDGQTRVAARWKLAVEQGWLVVRRETPAGDLEWHVVLARAAGGPPPQARVDPFSAVEVKYGGYFVREISGSLRVLRERKAAGSPPWPRPRLDPLGQSINQAGGAFPHITGWISGDWCWAASGPSDGRGDVWLRLQHKDLSGNGYGCSNAGNQLVRMFYGDKTVQDDGELLVADRATVEEVEHALLVKKIRKEIGTRPAPALVAREWLNAPGGLELGQLRGKVVLLDFWGTWCSPCVRKLPRTEELHSKYKDRGLVVIGVHSAQDGDKAGAFLKEKGYTFPVAVDKGPTADRYAVESWPTYFLIDKAGTVVWGFAHDPPKESQIEELLK